MGAPQDGGEFTGYFERNCQQNVLGTSLTDRIPNSKLYEKCRSIPPSRAEMRGGLRWVGHVQQMKDNSLLMMVLVAENRKQAVPKRGWFDFLRKELKAKHASPAAESIMVLEVFSRNQHAQERQIFSSCGDLL